MSQTRKGRADSVTRVAAKETPAKTATAQTLVRQSGSKGATSQSNSDRKGGTTTENASQVVKRVPASTSKSQNPATKPVVARKKSDINSENSRTVGTKAVTANSKKPALSSQAQLSKNTPRSYNAGSAVTVLDRLEPSSNKRSLKSNGPPESSSRSSQSSRSQSRTKGEAPPHKSAVVILEDTRIESNESAFMSPSASLKRKGILPSSHENQWEEPPATISTKFKKPPPPPPTPNDNLQKASATKNSPGTGGKNLQKREEKKEVALLEANNKLSKVSQNQSPIPKSDAGLEKRRQPFSPSEDDGYEYMSDDFEEYESDFEEDDEDDDDEEEGKTKEDEPEKGEDFEEEEEEEDEDVDGNTESENTQIDHIDGKVVKKAELLDSESKSWDLASSSPNPDSGFSTGSLSLDQYTKRTLDLLEILELDVVSYNLYDNPPISYGTYMHLFGRQNRKQVATQYKDKLEQAVQTDPCRNREIGVQRPCIIKDSDTGSDLNLSPETTLDPFSLLAFLQKSEKLIQTQIETEVNLNSQAPSKPMEIPKACLELVVSYYKLPMDSSIAKSSPVTVLHTDLHHFYVVQRLPEESEPGSQVSVWPQNLLTSSPKAILVARSPIRCLATHCFMVIAGLMDGSLVLWDLREPNSCHLKEAIIGNVHWILRSPSFSTALTSLQDTDNKEPILSLGTLHHSLDTESLCRIVSLNSSGLITFWVAKDLHKSDASFTPNEGEGMMPGSRLQLQKLTSISLRKTLSIPKGINDSSASSLASCMSCLPHGEENLYVGFQNGSILQVSRYMCSEAETAEADQASSFLRQNTLEVINSSVCAIDFNQVDPLIFLVAYTDGTISIYCTTREEPLAMVEPTESNLCELVDAKWLEKRQSAFIVLDKASTLTVFDVAQSFAKPLLRYESEKSRISCLANGLTGRRMYIAAGTEADGVEIFEFKEEFNLGDEVVAQNLARLTLDYSHQ